MCSLYLNGKVYQVRVAKALAETFIPNPNNYRFATLKDGNIENLDINNIEWSEKSNPRMKNLWEKGALDKICCENNISAKLTNEQVLYIRKHYKKGDRDFGLRAFAKKYNVCLTTICNVVNKNTWKNLERIVEKK